MVVVKFIEAKMCRGGEQIPLAFEQRGVLVAAMDCEIRLAAGRQKA